MCVLVCIRSHDEFTNLCGLTVRVICCDGEGRCGDVAGPAQLSIRVFLRCVFT